MRAIVLALPALLVVGAVARGAKVAPRPAPSTPAASDFGKAVAARAAKDLGVTDDGGAGSARIAAMLKTCGITWRADWCAAAIAAWIGEEAAARGVARPVAANAGAKATGALFRDPKNPAVGWIDGDAIRADASRLAPGMIVVWQRGAPGAWTGHIGVVDAVGPGATFSTIEGNTPSVARNAHDATASSILGAGYFIDAAIGKAVA